MLSQVQYLVNVDPEKYVPAWLLLTAKTVWPQRQPEFLRTCCMATVARIQGLLWSTVTEWNETLTQPPMGESYIARFGDDHEMVVVNDKIYQSYAFVHEVQESTYDPGKPLWQHVNKDPEGYRCYKPEFLVPQTS